MGSLWLYAIAVDEVRDIFSADEAEAAALRAIAAERFSKERPSAPGLLGRLGPVFRRPVDAPVRRPGVPDGEDCERMLAGRHIPPERVTACWALLQAWLQAKAWSSHEGSADPAQVDAIDFDLTLAGVPADCSLRSLLGRDPGIALQPAPGMIAGYSRGGHVLAVVAAWEAALPSLEPSHADSLAALLAWLGGFGEWTRAAAGANRQPPDLMGVWTA